MENKKILIIGGTGALGKELIKKYQHNNTIVVLSRDEHKQVALIAEDWVTDNVSFIIGDVKDKSSLMNAVEEHKPHIVINTAALKHVPVCQNNVYESVNVNILGHQNLIETIRRSNHRIETLIFISTDKACKPINVYGMCKAISEQMYLAFAKKQTEIKVCLVRYGNVLESTGSVIPYFKKLLNEGKNTLPITHVNMTRFLLTLRQATDLIDWAYKHHDSHGKIAIPKIKSFSIVSITNALFKWKGIDGMIQDIGIRPGEKLHEEMISSEEWMKTSDYENYLIGDKIIREDIMSYSSDKDVLTGEETYEFLKKTNVI